MAHPTAHSGTADHRMHVTCRKCGSRAERVPRGFIARRIFGWLSLKKFHCAKCMRNFYIKG